MTTEQQQTAAYIADHARNLIAMAAQQRLADLARMLEIVQLQAQEDAQMREVLVNGR